MSEPVFLALDEVLKIHTRSLAEHGDLFDVAASYAFYLAESQAFLDGNKRTAVAAAMIFLALNGTYAQPAKWELYLAMIEVAEKKLTKTDLAAIFRKAATK